MMIDEAIEHVKRVARTCDDDQCAAYYLQLAEWLRQVRGADKATKWYTAKIRELENRSKALETLISEKDTENAKLRKLARNMHGELVSCEDNGYVCGGHKFDDLMRDLGIE